MAGNFCYRVFFVFLLQVVKKFVPGGNISLSFSSPVAMLFMDHSSPTSEHMLSNVSYLLYTHSLAYSPYSYSCVLNTFFLLLSNFLLSLPTFLLPLSILLLFAFSSLSLSLSITMPFSSCLLNVLANRSLSHLSSWHCLPPSLSDKLFSLPLCSQSIRGLCPIFNPFLPGRTFISKATPGALYCQDEQEVGVVYGGWPPPYYLPCLQYFTVESSHYWSIAEGVGVVSKPTTPTLIIIDLKVC